MLSFVLEVSDYFGCMPPELCTVEISENHISTLGNDLVYFAQVFFAANMIIHCAIYAYLNNVFLLVEVISIHLPFFCDLAHMNQWHDT